MAGVGSAIVVENQKDITVGFEFQENNVSVVYLIQDWFYSMGIFPNRK